VIGMTRRTKIKILSLVCDGLFHILHLAQRLETSGMSVARASEQCGAIGIAGGGQRGRSVRWPPEDPPSFPTPESIDTELAQSYSASQTICDATAGTVEGFVDGLQLRCPA
jgi:hypothetical protein